MEKRILNYRKRIDELLAGEDADWERLREEHLVQVGFFQHERLVHLIVTVVFAILTMLALCMTSLTMQAGGAGGGTFLLLTVMFLILLAPYIRHYYILENEVQKMYRQYDIIVAKIRENGC